MGFLDKRKGQGSTGASHEVEQALEVIKLYIDLGAQFARFGAHDDALVCRKSAQRLLDELAGTGQQKKGRGDSHEIHDA